MATVAKSPTSHSLEMLERMLKEFHCVQCGETYCLTQSTVPKISIPGGFKSSSA